MPGWVNLRSQWRPWTLVPSALTPSKLAPHGPPSWRLALAARFVPPVDLTAVFAAALVAPMPFLGWEAETVQPGPSLSLYYQVSPIAWLVVAGMAVVAALAIALRAPRFVGPASAAAAILALPRLLLYDLTYLLVGASGSPDAAVSGAKIEAPGPS